MEQPLLLENEPIAPVKPSYPTLKESWGSLGWFILCTLAVALAVLVPTDGLRRQQGLSKPLIMAAVGEGGLLLTIWWLRRRAGRRWPRLGQEERAAPWPFYALLLALVPAQAIVLSTLALLPLPNWMQETFIDWARYPVVAFGIGSLVGPALEVYLFRGILLRGLLRNYRPWVAIGQSALLFGVFHCNPAQSLSAALLGLLLGWLYYRTRSLGLCIGLHMLNNAFAFAMLRFSSTARYAALSKQLGTGGYWAAVALGAVVLAGGVWWLNRHAPRATNGPV